MSMTWTWVFCASFVSFTVAASMFAGKIGAEGSMMEVLEVFVRSDARRRALAVARRDGIGGGGKRAVVRVVRKDWDGGGRDWARMAVRSWGMRSIAGFVDCVGWS